MRSLGVRCYKDAIALVCLDGTRDAPVIVEKSYTSMPSDTRSGQLSWLRREVLEVLDRVQPEAVSFKAPEPSAQTKDLQRAEAEGVFQEACATSGQQPTRRIKSQLKAALGYQGRAKYVERAVPPALSTLPSNRREAALVALAALEDA